MPKFLFKIYKRLSEKDDETNEDEHRRAHRSNLHDLNESDGITSEHARIIENSDIIMTFLNNREWIKCNFLDCYYVLHSYWFSFKKKGMHLQQLIIIMKLVCPLIYPKYHRMKVNY